MSNCSKCNSELNGTPNICPYCHHDIGAVRQEIVQQELRIFWYIMGLGVVLVLFLSPALLSYYVGLVTHVFQEHPEGFLDGFMNTMVRNLWTWVGCGAFWVIIWWFFFKGNVNEGET